MSTAGYVYLLRHGNTRWYKIGRTVQTTAKRQRGLTTGNPEGLTEVQSWYCETRHGDFEAYLHALFSAHHLSGRSATEFFDFTDVLTETELVARITQEHDRFTADLVEMADTAQLSTEMKPCNEQVQALLEERRDLQAKTKMAEIRIKTIDILLKQYIGTAAGIQDMNERPAVSWLQQTKTMFDTAAFRQNYPELAASFIKKIDTRVFRML